MNCLGLIELSDPVSFDPVDTITSVFFDQKNLQLFSVRSGGATGVVIKSPGKPQQTFILEDKGGILAIKLSPDQKVVSVQREKTRLDFYNIEKGQPNPLEYSIHVKNKNSEIVGYIWSTDDEVVLLTDTGIEIWNITASRKLSKYLRSTSTPIFWYVSCPLTNYLFTSAKDKTNTLQVWSVKNSNVIKLQGIDLSSSVTEKDVSFISVYSQCFIRVNIVGESSKVTGIHLYSIYNDQVHLSHLLNVSVSGALGVQTLDNLILVHSLQNSSTQMFDISSPRTKQTDVGGPQEHIQILPQTSLTDKGSCIPLTYPPSWVLFRPNILIDARNGRMWTLNLKLKRVESIDEVGLCRFLLHRVGGKPFILKHLKHCLQDQTVRAEKFSLMFYYIVLSYHIHQNLGDPPTLQGVGYVQSAVQIKPAVVLDQSELYTAVFSQAEKEGVQLERVQGVLVEYLLVLSQFKFPARQFILEMFINLAVQTKQFYQMHQYIQYGVIGDSKHIACILLSLESVYPPARQIALDMMARLGNGVEELLEICLAEGKVVQAINLAGSNGLGESISARKYLEASKDLHPTTFYHVYNFFEERNLRLRGNPRFTSEDKCEPFIQQFKLMFTS
ncbi:uncharacterized protein C18orf8 [Eurytemora carolleeae]|uniref:uncharacterized protein C18orf8 n=1 Tax=Eurytemora carolleeae TaxID=1294199 RepID=UPI000C7659DD|nr:uncharacterized protein C18orf8 [Eurytemora carolleeae]|eukprot:XP_023338353.1 uncharacterized protein C18orf8-like [Eurytemora affinis]